MSKTREVRTDAQVVRYMLSQLLDQQKTTNKFLEQLVRITDTELNWTIYEEES